MPYLRSKDFDLIIQPDNLAQVISSDTSIRLFAERVAKEEIQFYLQNKYDLVKEFTDTTTFDATVTYKAKNRVDYNDNLYFVSLPHPEFDYKESYLVGDEVWWKDKVYTCLIPTINYSHEDILQYNQYADVPIRNVFPDNTIYGEIHWGVGVAYSVTANTLPTDATKWTAGDNRSQLILENMLHIAMFKALPRIAPRNMPQNRKDSYNNAIAWLKEARGGEGEANLPLIQPATGKRILWGSNTKNINHY